MFSREPSFSQQLNSPGLSRATERYAAAAERLAAARFWRWKAASKALQARRAEYVEELIRAAEALRLERL